jgi:hypothetical protein
MFLGHLGGDVANAALAVDPFTQQTLDPGESFQGALVGAR